ncbi:MAG: SAM-dependent methyltransferase [Ilumatobacteraceae bacterium]|nr:SAM-dependent methyltransferase [Ilumatobacteraceae bacterium]
MPSFPDLSGKPVGFDVFMAAALYGEFGFYANGGEAGRRGDFITSPEIGPLFAAVLANWIRAEFVRLGEPDDFTIVEAGAGPGTLARSILLAAPQWAGRYVAVETSGAQRAKHPDGVRSLAAMPSEPFRGVVIANELLDNLPFRLAVYDGGWREAMVVVAAEGMASEVLAAAPAEWAWLPTAVPHGARVPVQHAAGEWVRAASSLLTEGTVLAFDYCTATSWQLANMQWREWLRTYRAQERGAHYLRDFGLQDITTQVCLDQLPEPTVVRPQAQFLQRWGIGELVDEGRAAWAVAAGAPNLTALRMRSRIRESESLLDPTGLGGFLAVEWST